MPRSAAIALDYDGTITTGDQRQIRHLKSFCESQNVNLYLNTARPQEYCKRPDARTKMLMGTQKMNRHHCLVDKDPVVSKVINMQKIAKKERLLSWRRAILVDDLAENIRGVKEAGFSGIKVNPKFGITSKTVDELKEFVLKWKKQDVSYRGASQCGATRRSRMIYIKCAMLVAAAVLVVLSMVL